MTRITVNKQNRPNITSYSHDSRSLYVLQTLARGLEGMLEYEGNVEETFMQTFSLSFKDVFGDVPHHELKENGQNIPVTNENRRVG